MLRPLLLLSMVFTLLSACGVSRMLENEKRSLSLEIDDPWQGRELSGGLHSESGSYFVSMNATVENTKGKEDFSVTFVGFQLLTASGRAYAASEESITLDNACDGAVTLTKKATVSCGVLFALDDDEVPIEVSFTTPEDRTTSADITLPACTWCGDVCLIDLLNNDEHCGECFLDVDFDQICVDGEIECAENKDTMCGDTCENTRNNSSHCGECDNKVPPGHVCEKGKAVCPVPGEDSCDDGCHNLDDDRDNCGECGRACPNDGFNPWCINGYTCEEYEQYSDADRTCDDACAELGLGYVCHDVTIWYSSYSYPDTKESYPECNEPAPDAPYAYHYQTTGCDCRYYFE
jgi:hypothetical protein